MNRLIASAAALLICSHAWALDPTRTIAQFHHTSWTVADGMPADILAIAQSQEGYMFLGSVNGLYRFDGVHVERYAADLLPSPSIHTLVTTPSGGLWIGYERPVGLISYLHNGVVTNYPLHADTTTRVVQIIVAPDQTVWAATPDTMFRFDGQEWVAMESDWGSALGQTPGGVWSFGIGRDGTVWSKNRLGLYYLPQGQSRFLLAHGYAGGPEAFMNTPDGRLWTTDTTAHRLYALPDLDPDMPVPPPPLVGVRVADTLQAPMLLDRDGTLWCASLVDGGICRILTKSIASDENHQGRLDKFRDGLSSNLVRTFFEDREGSIWVGTSLGLDRFRPANVVHETRVPAGFRARFVQRTQNVLYAYTGWSNSATRASDGTESLYRVLPHQAPELLIRNIGRLRTMHANETTGSLLVVTSNGVQQLEGSNLGPPVTLPQGVNGDFIYSAVMDNSGELWISAFYKGVFRRRSDKTWESVDIRSKYAATAVLIATPDGAVWARYSGGTLFRLHGNSTEDFSDRQIKIGDITLIHPYAHGLIFGGEGGMSFFDGKTFHSLSALDEPVLNVVTGIAESQDGSTWVFTQAGVLRMDRDNLLSALLKSDAKALRYHLIDSRDGLPGAPYGAVYGSTVATGPDGRVWFTTGEGLAWIDPTNLYRNPLPPPVDIQSLSTAGHELDAQRALSLAAGTRNVEINYTALSLSIPERVQFRYRLDGVDEDWVDAGNRRQAFYTQLGPGEHQFQVIAANSDGVWNSEGATLIFTIPPTFVQTKTFLALCIAGFAALLTMLYRARLTQVSARMRFQLEARMAERERIARELHDTLLQGFQGLMLRFQSVANRIAPDQPAYRLIEEAMTRGDEVLAEGRDRVRSLRGTEIAESLPNALQKRAQELSAGSDAEVRVVIEGTVRMLHPVVNDELVAICNEALTNAFRHSRAKNIDIDIVYRRRSLDVRIRDNGIGIDAAVLAHGRQGHFGLAGMRERAQKIRATLHLSSRSNAGTEVEIVVPASAAYAKRLVRVDKGTLHAADQ
ncbi:signal transduction histidine kinase/ligand-binding sensor domain-containing protein [Povalibacter uvarum]|uniref:Signal transduction histidine kinase/ligand-binding sensor domain-containing protein n=1 Tax=Povalibacter uvarum TaxID=732238 RepID=A0A841HSH0_9GAMM|nr:sensor histidine kinase [Povalibacter uvarum]MBB6095836.1 signal transduction histidine kinase/ligand-binding sensor domain-containing protein [Povalibacter uvarum]